MLPAALVIICLFNLHYPTRANPDAKGMANLLQTAMTENDLLIYDGRNTPDFATLAMFTELNQYLGQHKGHCLLLKNEMPDELRDATQQFHRIYVMNQRTVSPKGLTLPWHRFITESNPYYQLGRIYLFEHIQASPP